MYLVKNRRSDWFCWKTLFGGFAAVRSGSAAVRSGSAGGRSGSAAVRSGSAAVRSGSAAGCEARLCLAVDERKRDRAMPLVWPLADFGQSPNRGQSPTCFTRHRRRGVAPPHIRRQSRLSTGRQSRGGSQAGFTLLETTMAMVLMAIVGLGIAGLFVYAASSTSNAADREMASAVAQQQMEQLRSVAFTDSSLNATSSTGVDTTVTRLGRTYSVNTIIADSVVVNSAATLKTITIKVTPQSASAPWSSNVKTIFGSVTLVSTRSSLVAGPNRSF